MEANVSNSWEFYKITGIWGFKFLFYLALISSLVSGLSGFIFSDFSLTTVFWVSSYIF